MMIFETRLGLKVDLYLESLRPFLGSRSERRGRALAVIQVIAIVQQR